MSLYSALLYSVLFAAPWAMAAPPTLSHVFPAGGQRGTKLTVTASGGFTWPVNVSAPGVEATAAADSGKIEITIPADLPTDRVWLRLFNSEGASAAYPFLIGNLPEVAETEPNNTPKTAQKLADSVVVVNGVLEGADVDSFAVPLRQGQTLVAAVEANTALGSPMDAMLQIVAPDGVVLAENNDDVQLDPRLAYTAPRDGTYIARLFAFPSAPGTNIAFVGGANFVYRLTLTTGPYVAHTVPLAIPRAAVEEPGSGPTVEGAGWNLPPGTRIPVLPLGGDRGLGLAEFDPIDDLRTPVDARIGLAFSRGMAGGARIRLVPHAALPGLIPGPDDPPAELVPPSTATGWFRRKGQVDNYALPLKKGQPLLLAVESRSLNLLVDPVVILIDPTGVRVAEVDDTGATQDCALAHTAAHDGVYRVQVRDRYGQWGERCVYRLTARLEHSEFELNLPADVLTVEPGKPTELAVKIVRRTGPEGVVGPISIAFLKLPEGVSCPMVVSEPTGPTAGEVKLSLTSTGPAFSGLVQLAGSANQPSDRTRTARTPPRLGATLDSLWLTVVEKK